ncbi:hypothetical protein OESDEN_03185 [Oesophagostomum dentatum]|uniref:Phospholipase B-like n=1 Tax=Oesophagostomum dentatum TaxID=61180 RepID=A0A0B1TN54_OESDE|nr:hypothetical protein OESDEN_03185 [Oesophagostomum dentatum]
MTDFLTENQKFIKNKLEITPRDDVYWSAVNRTYHQLTGLIAGYEGRSITPGITFEIHPIL